jgi:CheY-like chemotaxis protein
VDDNETNLRIFDTLARKWGLHSHPFSSPRDALAWLRAGHWPDLLLTDMQMPAMDGLDFALGVRDLERAAARPPMAILLVSSGGYAASDPRTAGARLAAVLNKPTRQAHLRRALNEALAPVGAATDRLKSARDESSVEFAREFPRRVLVAEDNVVNQKVATRLLATLGFRADIASDGREAVAACHRVPYDLVFMDVHMPELDGLDASRQLRAELGARCPHIVAMTASAMEGDREMCLAAGMHDYVTKPVHLEEIKRVIAASPSPRPMVAQ